MAAWIRASWTRWWMFALAAWMVGLAGVGCATKEFPEALRQTLAVKANDARGGQSLAASTPSAHNGSLLVVMSYGFGCSGSGPGNGLRDVAETIRRQYPTDRVITRAWNDDDDIARTIQDHPGPVALIGHSFGGSKSVELATRLGRPIDWMVLLDPVPCDDWAFRHSGKYFQIPRGVRNAVCFYRPAGAWPISYPIVNPATPSANRQRNLGHAAFGENAEVRDYILNFCAVEAAKSKPVVAGVGAGGHS